MDLMTLSCVAAFSPLVGAILAGFLGWKLGRAFSHALGDLSGQVFVFFILTVAAAESAIGLAILVALFRNLRSINVADLDSLKG